MDKRVNPASLAKPRKRPLSSVVPSATRLISQLVRRAMQAIAAPTPAPGKLVFESFEPRVLLSGDTVVPRIDGNLDVPGETDRYGFTVEDNIRVVFDSLTNRSDMHWSIEGPQGAVVTGRRFDQSDSNSIGGNVAFDLTAGDYTLSVDGTGDTTGAYSFRLVDIARATELTPGTPVSGQLAPANETDAYKFSVAAGQRFYFDSLQSPGGAYWRLLDPFGRTVTGPTHLNSDIGALRLDVDGSYTLLVEGEAGRSGAADYRINVVALQDAAPVAMALGDVVAGRIDGAGLRNAFAFDLAADTRVLFDSLAEQVSLRWSLTGPRGPLVESRRLLYSDSHEIAGNNSLLLAAGSYTLTIDGEGDAVGDYAFRLLDFAAATGFSPNSAVEGVLGDAGVGSASRHVVSGAPLAYPAGETNRAFAHDGSNRYIEVADSASLNPAQLTLEAWVRRDATLGNWGSVLMKSSTSSWNDGWGLGNHTDGRIHFFVNEYSSVEVSADLEADVWTHVAATYDGAALKLYLNGALVASRDHTAAIEQSSQPLRIGSGAGAEYPWKGQIDEVRVWGVARTAEQIAASFGSTLIGNEAGLAGYWRFDEAIGETFADRTANANDGVLVNSPAIETRLYRFDASAGERFYFDPLTLDGDNFSLRVFDPAGKLVAGPRWFTDHADVFTAERSGSYLLALEGRIYHDNPSRFRFNLQRVVDASAALSLGSRIDAAIAHAGQRQSYTFSVTDSTRVVFDALSGDSRFDWTLAGPSGTLVERRSFANSDSAERADAVAIDLTTGDYTLTVDASDATTGDFAFRLLDVAAARSIAYGEEVSSSLQAGNETHAFNFTASRGDELLFDWRSLSGGDPYWRLIDPTGRQVYGPDYFGQDRGPIVLYQSGRYTLLLEGRSFQSDDVDYAFALGAAGQHADRRAGRHRNDDRGPSRRHARRRGRDRQLRVRARRADAGHLRQLRAEQQRQLSLVADRAARHRSRQPQHLLLRVL